MKDDDLDDLDGLVTALLTASRALVGVSAQSLADVEDRVTLAQFRTLVVLRAHGATRLNGLSARLGVNASTALRSVDRMVTAGLVARHERPDDRREVVIDLTPRGQRLVDEVTERRRATIEGIVRRMPTAERSALVAALRAFATAADEPEALRDPATLLGW